MLDKAKTKNDVVKSCIDYLNEYAKSDAVFRQKLETNSQTTEDLEWYIMGEARKHLGGRSGAIEKETVYGWAIHFVDENITKTKSTPASNKLTTSKKSTEVNTEDTLDNMNDKYDSEETTQNQIKTAVKKTEASKKKTKEDLYQGASLFDF